MKALPGEDELWDTWVEFLPMYGTVRADPDVGATVSCEGRVSLFRLSRIALYVYVRDFVRWRREHGLSDGLGDGLPLPLTDSFGDCLGPQRAAYAEFAIDGLGFEPVPGFPAPEIVLPPGLKGHWEPATRPQAADQAGKKPAS
jgi:hypothetical protein